MSGKIDAYVDCVSPYAYFSIRELRADREALRRQGVTVEFHPFFLGGVMHGSENTPPWRNPAKARHGEFDRARAIKYFGSPDIRPSPNFPIDTLKIQRALTYIKAEHGDDAFEAALLAGATALWEHQKDIGKPDVILEVLGAVTTPEIAAAALAAAADPAIKAALQRTTQAALDQGAYGAPWFWVRNKSGAAEPFFGTDRFHYMWEFLGLKWARQTLVDDSKL